jgi:hypothetical protein
VQVALSIVLGISAAVLARTVYGLANVNVGFDTRGLYSVPLRPGDIGYDDARRNEFFRAVERRLNATPGIAAAAYGWSGHLGNMSGARLVGPYPGTDATSIDVLQRSVTADYFRTLGIPIVAGRAMTRAEGEQTPMAPVALIDQSLAGRLFGSSPPLGADLQFSRPSGQPTRAVVIGVVGDTRSREVRDGPDPTVYVPASSLRIATFHVRSSLPRGEAVALIRRTIRAIEPALAADSITTVTEELGVITSQERLLARLSIILAALALAIAVAGVYTTVTCGVAERTREFGIRVALGATRGAIAREALGQAGWACAAGVLMGLLVYAFVAQPLGTILFEVTVLDPVSIAACTTLFAATVFAATWPQARRAGRTDPAVTLRSD